MTLLGICLIAIGILILVVTVIMVPTRYDPAIRLREWLDKTRT